MTRATVRSPGRHRPPWLVGCGDDDEPSSSGGGTGSSSSSDDQPGEGKPAVTIGTKDFTEEFVLGNLYAQALEAKGYKVNLKENIGSTEIIDKALTSRRDRRLSRVHRRVAVGRRQERHPRREPRADPAAREGVLRGPRPGGQRRHAVPGHRRDRHHQGVRREEQPQAGRPTSRISTASRSAPGPSSRAASTASRAWSRSTGSRQRQVQAARARPAVPVAGQGRRRHRQRVLDRRAAGLGQVHGARGPEGRVRLPERLLRHQQGQVRRARRRRSSWTSSTRSTSC